MADCHHLFTQFGNTISISETRRQELMNSRDAIRERMRIYFSDNLGFARPKFYQQGSFKLRTLIQSLPGMEIDLDDGVYLQHLPKDKSKWPATEQVHDWVYQSVKNHTDQKTEDKNNCVRVIYAANHHIDLPIYAEHTGKIYLARKGGNEWVNDDPKKFADWFVERVKEDEQIRRCIRYLKAWNDFSGTEIPGIVITVLLGNTCGQDEDRDDMRLLQATSEAISTLRLCRTVNNPVDPSENLIGRWTASKVDSMINAISQFCEKGNECIQQTDIMKAHRMWIGLFGDRFPVCKEGKEANLNKSSQRAGTTVITAPSKPWGGQ